MDSQGGQEGQEGGCRRVRGTSGGRRVRGVWKD